MNLDLNNEKEFDTAPKVFNGGEAGEAKGEIYVKKKGDDDHPNSPDYKLFVKDDKGEINQGFYYPTRREGSTDAAFKSYITREVGRVLSIARAATADIEGFVFPEVDGAKEAFDTLFKIIAKESKGKKFRVYTNYGTSFRPSSWLQLRYFDFIKPESDTSAFRANNDDLLARVVPDKEEDSFGIESESLDDDWFDQ